MREKGVHAGPGRRRIEGQRRLSILLEYGGVVIHGHTAVGVPICGYAKAEDREVAAVGQRRGCGDAQ